MKSIMNRRDALRSALAVAAASALPSVATAAVPRTGAGAMPIKLGLATYTFRNFDTAHLIEFAKTIKTSNLNLKDMHLKPGTNAEVAAQAAMFRSQGFVLEGAGNITFFKNDEADMRSKFEYVKAAGIKTMVCAPTQETLPTLEKLVKEYDVRLAIHAHGPEDKYFHSPLDVIAFVKNMDPRIGLCIDVGHTMRSGTDVPTAIRAGGARVYDIHMKDLANATEKESQVAVGEGIMPVRAIFQALIDIKYPGYVDLEYEIEPTNPLPGVMQSFAYMRGVLSGMGYGW